MQQITFVVFYLEGASWQGWNEVDHVLAGVQFGRLKEVAIVVYHCRDMDMTRQRLVAQFSSMYDRGILNIRKPNYKQIIDHF